MEDNVLIKIKTYQDIDGDGDEPIELETSGKFGMINGKYYIKYRESEMTGFSDTTTTIKVWNGNVIVTRRGRYNMKICYVEGEKKLCLYPTPYGDVSAAIETYDVAFDLESERGWLKVDYSIDADNENFCKNSLNVKLEPLAARSTEDKPRRRNITGMV